MYSGNAMEEKPSGPQIVLGQKLIYSKGDPLKPQYGSMCNRA